MDPITMSCRAVSSIAEIIQAANNAVEAMKEGDPDRSKMQMVSAIIHGLGSVFQITDGVGRMSGLSAKTLKTIKVSEIFTRIIESCVAPSTVCLEPDVEAHQDDMKGVLKFMEKAIIVPFASFSRAVTDLSILNEQIYLEMSPEELSKATRPAYEGEGKDRIYIGEKPVTKEECQKNIDAALGDLHVECVSETLFRLEAVSGLTSQISKIIEKLFEEVRRDAGPVPHPEEHPAEHHEGPLPIDPFNLKARKTIPEALHGDTVFKRYICPITNKPIRNPVGDPNDRRIVYEKEAIESAIARTGKSPITGRSLEANQLLSLPHIRASIADRLTFYEEAILRLVEAGRSVNADQALLAAAEAEQRRG